MAMFFIINFFSAIFKIFSRRIILTIFSFLFLILIAIFLPYRRADLTASASLQGTRGEVPQLRTLCLASAATSTRE
jgi:hypothetical protein